MPCPPLALWCSPFEGGVASAPPFFAALHRADLLDRDHCIGYAVKTGRFFKEPLDYIHQFVPQMVFLMFIFGYLVVMIFYKWASAEFPQGNPPSLLLMLINMFLKMGSPIEDGEVLYGDKDGKTQQVFQTMLVGSALVCVPWMLLWKPLALKVRALCSSAGCWIPVMPMVKYLPVAHRPSPVAHLARRPSPADHRP
jgi:vacuolar-type H+-ATPase subunit I/STV1